MKRGLGKRGMRRERERERRRLVELMSRAEAAETLEGTRDVMRMNYEGYMDVLRDPRAGSEATLRAAGSVRALDELNWEIEDLQEEGTRLRKE